MCDLIVVIENQMFGIGVLMQFVVYLVFDVQIVGIIDFVGCYELWFYWCVGVEGFVYGYGWGMNLLIVYIDIVVDKIIFDDFGGVFFRDMFVFFVDDKIQFGFVVEEVGYGWFVD